jgi:hypothetical protein
LADKPDAVTYFGALPLFFDSMQDYIAELRIKQGRRKHRSHCNRSARDGE